VIRIAVSVVVKLNLWKESFLFTGDLPQNQENETSAKWQFTSIERVKVGHHGSKLRVFCEFFDVVHPEYGVISVGAGNKYGHPNKEVLTLAETDKYKFYEPIKGRIIFELTEPVLF